MSAQFAPQSAVPAPLWPPNCDLLGESPIWRPVDSPACLTRSAHLKEWPCAAFRGPASRSRRSLRPRARRDIHRYGFRRRQLWRRRRPHSASRSGGTVLQNARSSFTVSATVLLFSSMIPPPPVPIRSRRETPVRKSACASSMVRCARRARAGLHDLRARYRLSHRRDEWRGVASPIAWAGRTPPSAMRSINPGAANYSTLTRAAACRRSITTATPSGTGVTISGIDFGFNFDTVVNTRDLATARLQTRVTLVRDPCGNS